MYHYLTLITVPLHMRSQRGVLNCAISRHAHSMCLFRLKINDCIVSLHLINKMRHAQYCVLKIFKLFTDMQIKMM